MSFVGFAAFEAEDATLAAATTRRAFAGKDDALSRACKSCGKKDATTRLRGLASLAERASSVDARELALVAAWWAESGVARSALGDDDARVREAAAKALEACAAAGAPLRRFEGELAGPWWAATADGAPEVARAAVAAWRAAFPKNGGVAGAARNRAAILDFLGAALASDDDAARSRALGAAGKLVDAARSTGVDDRFRELLRAFAAQPATFKALKGGSGDVLERRACYGLLARLAARAPDACALDGGGKKVGGGALALLLSLIHI